MKLGVFGTGYVGLVTGICFAEMGNTVTCVDIDKEKIEALKKAIPPIYEPGLKELLVTNLKSNRISFTNDLKAAIEACEVLFIAVGTPSSEDGSADLSFVYDVAKTIGQNVNAAKMVVVKSTVPIGTNLEVKEIILQELKKRKLEFKIDMVSNPEFLREGSAIEDCLRPDRVVIGCESPEAAEMMSRVYRPFLTDKNQLIVMDLFSSELTKYAANAMLATKISFMNELSQLCKKLDANIDNVKRGIGADHRIGPFFINAGIGFGGSCFPKDVRALMYSAIKNDIQMPILAAVEQINHRQRMNFIDLILKKLPKNSKVALWGVAFKPGTDDIREAPALDIMTCLIQAGHSLQVFDPIAAAHAKSYFAEKDANFIHKIEFLDNQYDVLKNAEALIIATEWEFFREPDFSIIKQHLKNQIIFDGRNIYEIALMKNLGFKYYSIGRPYIE